MGPQQEFSQRRNSGIHKFSDFICDHTHMHEEEFTCRYCLFNGLWKARSEDFSPVVEFPPQEQNNNQDCTDGKQEVPETIEPDQGPGEQLLFQEADISADRKGPAEMSTASSSHPTLQPHSGNQAFFQKRTKKPPVQMSSVPTFGQQCPRVVRRGTRM